MSRYKHGDRVFVIAEIGINANGDVKLAKELIDMAAECDCDAVKFQKRDPDICVPEHQKTHMRETPWGYITYLDYKKKIEFGEEEYDEIDRYCKEKGIEWFASAWDVNSRKFLEKYDTKYNKVASAMLTDRELLEAIASEKKYTFISTGMSTIDQIKKATQIFKDADCPFELMHCNSVYPMEAKDANLLLIPKLKEEFGCDVGYSGHETGIVVTFAAVAMGASSVERHITLDRSMYGTDQSASLERVGLERLIRYIRSTETAFGDGVKTISEGEAKIAKKLRNKSTL
jgi:N-acetylneuraminate synthase